MILNISSDVNLHKNQLHPHPSKLFQLFIIRQIALIYKLRIRRTMRSSHEPKPHQNNLLLAGINRIRFIKQKQLSNHNKIAMHLAEMVSRFSQKKGRQTQVKLEQSAQYAKQNDFIGPLGENGERSSMTRVSTSRRKFKMSHIKSKYMMQTTQQDSSIAKTSLQFEESLANSQLNVSQPHSRQLKNRPQRAKLKEVLQNKTNNYKIMKEQEQEMELIRKLKSQESQRILKERVAIAAQRKQEGRRKVEESYFEYIQNIQMEKDRQKSKKNSLTQKRMQEMLKLQLQEKSQIQQFQSSLALEDHLKSFIKEKLPLSSQSNAQLRTKQSIFS